ncbi:MULTISPECIES: thioredoxin [Moraxella]|nr:thioredoxin [Moraxella lacunata]MDH9219800.1 thioredoxin [Moraxella lacunata]
MPMSIINTTDANFDQDVLQADKPVLVDFWAAWCGPCKAIAPVLEDLDAEYGDKFQIVKVNVDDNPETSARFGIRSIPTLFVFKNGEKVDTVVGSRPKSEFVELLNKHL